MKLKFSDRVRTLTALSVFLIALVFGLFTFLSRYAYAEDGHNILLTIYIVACFGLLYGIRSVNLPVLGIALVVALVSQVYAAQKFDWREAYIESAIAGNPFPLEEMVDHYPSFEEHTFSFLNAPDWVRFNTDCIQPALKRIPARATCTSTESILKTYRIDIIEAMKLHLIKMQSTAKMLEEGRLKKRSEYLECIRAKGCVSIPLLPKGIDAEKLDQSSTDYIDIRQAFWSLVKDKKMSRETCGLTDICKALVGMQLINPDSMPF